MLKSGHRRRRERREKNAQHARARATDVKEDSSGGAASEVEQSA